MEGGRLGAISKQVGFHSHVSTVVESMARSSDGGFLTKN